MGRRLGVGKAYITFEAAKAKPFPLWPHRKFPKQVAVDIFAKPFLPRVKPQPFAVRALADAVTDVFAKPLVIP